MREFTNEQSNEILEFKEIALALMSGDTERIIESGYLDKSNYYNSKGKKIKSFDDIVSQDLAEKLSMHSKRISSAWEIDEMHMERNDEFSIANVENERKAYAMFSVFEGDHVSGNIVISNTGEFMMYVSDNDGELLHVFNHESHADSELYLCADHIAGGDFLNYEMYDQGIREKMHYFDTATVNDFETEKEYLNYKIEKLTSLIEETHNLDEYSMSALDEAKSNKHDTSYIISGRTVIIENEGNFCIIDFDQKDVAFTECGEEFDFRGETHIACPNILKTIDMQMYDDEEYEYSHRNIEEEPRIKQEDKKTRTRKPGM